MLFKNKKHNVYIVNQHKITLNRDDAMRRTLEDVITKLSRAYLA